jgi:hypothetical protein
MVGAIIDLPMPLAPVSGLNFSWASGCSPKMASHLGLIHPAIEVSAIECFGTGFARLRVRGSEFAELP